MLFFFGINYGSIKMDGGRFMYVVITGASGDLGRKIARKFASSHYNLVLLYYKNDICEYGKNLASEFGINVFALACDITNEEDVKKLQEKIKKENIDVTCLVNNAGISCDGTIEEKTIDNFRWVLDVNLGGTFLVTKYIGSLIKQGSIINVSSNCGIDAGYVEGMDYNASKAGVISLTHDFAKIYAPRVRVNAVAPGWIETTKNKELLPNFKKEEMDKCLLGRFASPDEIASVIFFLSSRDASYINDSIIKVDGGLK